jgi:hypothetical protein
MRFLGFKVTGSNFCEPALQVRTGSTVREQRNLSKACGQNALLFLCGVKVCS